MNREEFMKELEYLLSDIPDEEKAEAIGYYRDYLEEAGEGGGGNQGIRKSGAHRGDYPFRFIGASGGRRRVYG